MIDKVQSFLLSESSIKLLTVLITFFSTYFIAKYNLNNPRKLKIKQLQFDNVYLPIYKLIYKDINKPISKELAIKYCVRIKSILHKNYELAFPQLHKLNDSLLEALQKNNDYQSLFNKICYQVSVEYSLLTKSLGYPSENTFSLFRRMYIKDKIKVILEWLGIVYSIFFPILAISFLNDNILLYTILFIFGAYIIIKIHDSIY